MPTKVPTGLILIYVLHILYVSLLSVTTGLQKTCPDRNLESIPTMPRERKSLFFLEIINGGIENNVLTDTIREAFVFLKVISKDFK